jgi:hypothetical protein
MQEDVRHVIPRTVAERRIAAHVAREDDEE